MAEGTGEVEKWSILPFRHKRGMAHGVMYTTVVHRFVECIQPTYAGGQPIFSSFPDSGVSLMFKTWIVGDSLFSRLGNSSTVTKSGYCKHAFVAPGLHTD